MAKIYFLTHPTSSRLYIGKTARALDERLKDHVWHINTGAATKKNNWMKSLKNKGLKPEIGLIAEVEDSKWEEAEKFYIKLGWQVAPDDMLNDPSAPGGKGSSFTNRERHVKKYIHKRYAKTCPVCKNEFTTKRDKIVYCSKKCAAIVCYENKREKMQSANTKLSPTDVETIVTRINNGEYIKDIAEDYGVSSRAISDNLNGKRKSGVKIARKRIVTASKLNESQVEEIRFEYAKGKVSQKELGSKFNVDQSAISDIVRGKSWKITN